MQMWVSLCAIQKDIEFKTNLSITNIFWMSQQEKHSSSSPTQIGRSTYVFCSYEDHLDKICIENNHPLKIILFSFLFMFVSLNHQESRNTFPTMAVKRIKYGKVLLLDLNDYFPYEFWPGDLHMTKKYRLSGQFRDAARSLSFLDVRSTIECARDFH